MGYAILLQGHLQQIQKVIVSYSIRKSHGDALNINLRYSGRPLSCSREIQKYLSPVMELSYYIDLLPSWQFLGRPHVYSIVGFPDSN